MYKECRIGAILLMGGSGSRFGGPTPKQFCLLNGTPLYQYALETFIRSKVFDQIVLVCHPDWMDKITPLPIMTLTPGGTTRQESSKAGLHAFTQPPDIVLIHDAVRPFVTEAMILTNLDAALAWGAADTCIPTADTLVYSPNGDWIHSIPKREEFLRGQTPQTFRYDLILKAHAQADAAKVANASDDCRLLLEMGTKVGVVLGSEENFKITSEFDLTIAEALLAIGKGKVEKSESNDPCSEEKRCMHIPTCQGPRN